MAEVNLEDFVYDQVGDVKLLTNAIELFVLDGAAPYSIRGRQAFLAFLEKRDVYYYARPRNQFSIVEALQQAKDNGKTYLVAEDLSNV